MKKYMLTELSVAILILVLGLSATISSAAQKDTPRSKKSGTVNLHVEHLPKSFDGDNRRIVEMLKAFNIEKSEFETGEAYAKRTEALKDRLYAFSYKPRRSDEFGGIFKKEVSYDAETSSLTIRLGRIKGIQKSWDDVRGSYIGQNAFGAKVRIEKGTRNTYYVSLPEEEFSADLAVSPTAAKRIADSIRVLYWVKLRDVKCQKDTISPTTDNPFHGGYIKCESRSIPVETWVYDFKTGEVFKKEKPEQEQATSK
jgi:hypothetical protein